MKVGLGLNTNLLPRPAARKPQQTTPQAGPRYQLLAEDAEALQK
jgi:hypothetical protein